MGCFRFHFHGLKQILFLILWDPVAPHHFPQSHAIHAMERLGAGINEQKYESESIQMRQIVVGTPQKKAFICLVLLLRTYCNWQYFSLQHPSHYWPVEPRSTWIGPQAVCIVRVTASGPLLIEAWRFRIPQSRLMTFHDMPKRLYWGTDTRLRSLTYLFLRLALLLLR